MLYNAFNPIPYILSSLAGDVTYTFLKLEIETFAYSNVWEKIDDLECVPTDGEAVFYLQEYLKERLSYDLPDWLSSSVQTCEQVCKRFRVSTATITAEQTFEDVEFTEDETENFVLLGGFDFNDFPNRGSFVLPNSDKQFLSKLPYSILDRDQKAYLFYIHFANATGLTASIEVLYDDATTNSTTLNLGDVSKYQPIIIPVSFSSRNYQSLDISKTIAQITYTIGSKSFVFECVQNFDLQSIREIYFANSLGGFEAVSCTGVFEEEVTAEHSPFEHYLPYNYTNNNRQMKSYNHQTQSKGKIRSGFMPKSIYLPLVKDLLLSKEVFLREGDTFFPIRITSKKQDLFSSQNSLYAFDVEFEYANKIVN